MEITINRTAYNLTTRKRILELGLLIWVLGLLISMIIMWSLDIHPENQNPPWGITHPKYLQFEIIMIPSMIVLMFLVIWLFYGYPKNSGKIIDLLTDGLLVMITQFVLDFFVLVLLFKSGLSYFYGLVTLSYLSIPLQWVFYVWIKNKVNNKISE